MLALSETDPLAGFDRTSGAEWNDFPQLHAPSAFR